MLSTTRYRRGDIVLVPFPFSDLSSTKKRPALVVSPDGFNKRTQDVVLVAITSQPSDSYVVALSEADYVDGELPLASFVKISKLFTIHPTLVLKKVCAVRPTRLEIVLKELRRFFR
ncbi:MAG: type II toxin-antitoxin system PemK/MazF family toxin [Bryobacterales bacterium]|nr:type II toxin-antitoxin system PemK/MazF family toxin [Bryobacterales bacterium]